MKIRLASFLVFSSILFVFSVGAAKGKRTVTPESYVGSAAGTLAPLSEVLAKDLNGLAAETPALLESIRGAAHDFAASRKARGYTPEKFALLRRCVADETANPLCAYLIRGERPARASSARQSRAEQRRLARAFRAGDMTALNVASESSLIDALKSFSTFKSLRPIADRALESATCPAPSLLTSLGMKAERDFPKPEYKALATSLYGRAIACAEGHGAARAAYRLGLFQLGEGRVAEADRSLAQVVDDKSNGEYDSRALYWRGKLAVRAGETQKAAELKAQLIQDYPLTLHALLADTEGGKFKAPSYLSPEDPLVAFRSRAKPELNGLIASIEALQSQGELRAAYDVLEASMDRFRDAEREVRLYTAVLFKRSGDSLKKFQVLSALFKEHRSLMSKASLELFYPRIILDSVTKACGEKLDPYLMLSLIRQESAFNENARSGAGAIGLMQVMPRTGHLVSRVSRNQLFNPDVNVKVGVKYFSRLMERFDGSVEHALAAYNAGPERVDEWVERYPVKDRMLFVDLVPFRETREYVASIARNYFWYLSLYKKESLEIAAPVRALASQDAATQPFLFNFIAD
jgi:soluble lytic murein transglycosylase